MHLTNQTQKCREPVAAIGDLEKKVVENSRGRNKCIGARRQNKDDRINWSTSHGAASSQVPLGNPKGNTGGRRQCGGDADSPDNKTRFARVGDTAWPLHEQVHTSWKAEVAENAVEERIYLSSQLTVQHRSAPCPVTIAQNGSNTKPRCLARELSAVNVNLRPLPSSQQKSNGLR